MFKRKQAIPPTVGSFCTIKKELISKLIESPGHKENSVSYFAETHGFGTIQSRMFNKQNNRRILLQDCSLLYIETKSIFNGLVRVLPLAVENDSNDGVAIRKAVYGDAKNKSFLVSTNSLSLVGQSYYDTIVTKYCGRTQRMLEGHVEGLLLKNHA